QILTLSTGNVVVADSGANNFAGAVCLFNGTTGALISELTGSAGGFTGDAVGDSVTALTNGNFVVASFGWGGGRGAVTWASGVSGVSGVVSAANSLVGSQDGDALALNGVTALANGDYVVASPDWNGLAGAATWGSGVSGI